MDWDRLKQQLPAHAAVLESALASYRTEKGVVGIYLKGSLAREDYDRWSDIDFHLIVTEEAYPALLAERPDRMRSLGRTLCEWSSTGEHQLLCLYDSGVTLEIDFHLPVRLTRPRAGMDREMAILHDPTGAIAAFKAGCAALAMPVEVDPQRLLHLWNKVWAWLYSATGKAYRGELWEAQDFLNAIRQGAILPVYRTLKGRAPFGYRRLEGWAEPEFLRRLELTHSPPDRDATAAALRHAVEFFAELARDLAVRYKMTLPDQPAEAALLLAKTIQTEK